jgi:hypothetical protein
VVVLATLCVLGTHGTDSVVALDAVELLDDSPAVIDAKLDWAKAERLSVATDDDGQRIEPVFKSLKNGDDMTFVKQITQSIKTKEKAKMIKDAQKVLASAEKLTNAPEPKEKPLMKLHQFDKQKKAAMKALTTRLTKEQAQELVISKTLQDTPVMRLKAQAAAAKSALASASAEDAKAAARVASDEELSYRHAKQQAKRAAAEAKKQRLVHTTAVKKAATAVRLEVVADKHPEPWKTAKKQATAVSKATAAKKSAAKMKNMAGAAVFQTKKTTPVSVVRAMKEVAIKTGMKVQIKQRPAPVNAKQKAAATAKKGKSKPLVSSESVEDQKEKQRHLQIMLHQKLSSLNQEVAARAAKALKNKVANAAKAEAAKAKAAAKAAKAKAAQEKGGKAAGLRR